MALCTRGPRGIADAVLLPRERSWPLSGSQRRQPTLAFVCRMEGYTELFDRDFDASDSTRFRPARFNRLTTGSDKRMSDTSAVPKACTYPACQTTAGCAGECERYQRVLGLAMFWDADRMERLAARFDDADGNKTRPGWGSIIRAFSEDERAILKTALRAFAKNARPSDAQFERTGGK